MFSAAKFATVCAIIGDNEIFNENNKTTLFSFSSGGSAGRSKPKNYAASIERVYRSIGRREVELVRQLNMWTVSCGI